MGLFAEQEQAALRRVQPLAVRMRPRTLDEFVGQESLLGPGKLLRRLVEGECLTSVVFWGPPGCGKTALAHLIARRGQAAFETLHAAEADGRDVRAARSAAAKRPSHSSARRRSPGFDVAYPRSTCIVGEGHQVPPGATRVARHLPQIALPDLSLHGFPAKLGLDRCVPAEDPLS